MPASRRANKRKRLPSSVTWRHSRPPWPRTTTQCCLHPSCLIMGSVAVVETAPPETVGGLRPAWATLRRSASSRPIGEPAVLRSNGCSGKHARHMAAVSCAWSIPVGMLLTAICEPRGSGRRHFSRGRTGRMAPALLPNTPDSRRESQSIQNRPRWCGTCVAG
jgi:hypothetical protein